MEFLARRGIVALSMDIVGLVQRIVRLGARLLLGYVIKVVCDFTSSGLRDKRAILVRYERQPVSSGRNITQLSSQSSSAAASLKGHSCRKSAVSELTSRLH